jgi:hypothetical protein
LQFKGNIEKIVRDNTLPLTRPAGTLSLKGEGKREKGKIILKKY